MQRQIRRALQRDDVAVSAVIGTILMIAATVILGGVIYAAVSGFGQKSTGPTQDFGFKVQSYDATGAQTLSNIRVTYVSGAKGITPTVTVESLSGGAPPGTAASYLTLCSNGSTTGSGSSVPIGTSGPVTLNWATANPGDFAVLFSGAAASICSGALASGSYLLKISVGGVEVAENTITI